MKKLSIITALALLATGASAIEFGYNGSVGSFTKAGFNTKYDSAQGKYPTESFTTILGSMSANATIIDGLKVGVGGAIGGLAYDSTSVMKDGGGKIPAGERTYSTPVSWWYYGVNYRDGDAKPQNYVLHSAYVSYENEFFGVKAGRYEAGSVGYYFGGFNQGAEIYAKFAGAKIWAFYSDKRALAYSQWLYDFYGVAPTGSSKGLLAGGAEYEIDGFKVGAFVYGKSKTFTAPGFTLSYAGDFDGFGSSTRFFALFPTADSSMVAEGEKKSSSSFYLEQKFTMDKINFGGGVYVNSGKANKYIGSYGNPLMLDMWTNTAYTSPLSAMVGEDAKTGFLFGGLNYGKLNLTVIARITNEKRHNEQSMGLLLDYSIRDDLSIGGKLECLSDTTKAVDGVEKRTDDRSHAFFYINHSF